MDFRLILHQKDCMFIRSRRGNFRNYVSGDYVRFNQYLAQAEQSISMIIVQDWAEILLLMILCCEKETIEEKLATQSCNCWNFFSLFQSRACIQSFIMKTNYPPDTV